MRATTTRNRVPAAHDALLESLNERQREAVATGDGPVLVIAGPGSGKTRIICTRIAYLVRAERARPAAIAAITFTRRAAGQMAERVRALLPGPDGRAVWISTFHRLCGHLLREHGPAGGLRADFRIIEGAEQLGVMRQCMFDANIDTRIHKPQALLHQLSTIKNRMRAPANPESWGGNEFAERNARLAAAYQAALAQANALDFDDMLLAAVRLLHNRADIRAAAGQRFTRLLVDEYQDTNLPQYVLVRQLSEGHGDVFVVGDPDQAIYGWRGAELDNIMSFQRDFPAARRIDLDVAYRSTGRLLAAAGAMIERNRVRLERKLRPANPPGLPPSVHAPADALAEAAFAVERAGARIRQDNGSVAVLYRTNAQSRAFETAFKRAGIPYRITGGESFYNRPEIRDALACLHAAADPDADDDAMRRFIDLPPHPRTGRQAAATIDTLPGATFWQRAGRALQTGALTQRQAANLALRTGLAARLRAGAERVTLDRLVDAVLDETGYRAAVSTSADPDAADRLDNLAELAFDAEVFQRDAGEENNESSEGRLRTLTGFLAHCRSMAAPDRTGSANARVTLSTLHGAKGLEFDTVIIAGFDAEHVPHPRTVRTADDPEAALEEERRLAYVGMTRARSELYLSTPRVTGHGARQRATTPSEFIREIPEELRTTSRGTAETNQLPPQTVMGPYGPEKRL